MKEKLLNLHGPFQKYTAHIRNKKQKQNVSFISGRRYQQYKDRTGLGLYSHKNHNTRKRMQNYFSRHSGTKNRTKAIKKEIKKSNGLYNAKILSHIYLW